MVVYCEWILVDPIAVDQRDNIPMPLTKSASLPSIHPYSTQCLISIYGF